LVLGLKNHVVVKQSIITSELLVVIGEQVKHQAQRLRFLSTKDKSRDEGRVILQLLLSTSLTHRTCHQLIVARRKLHQQFWDLSQEHVASGQTLPYLIAKQSLCKQTVTTFRVRFLLNGLDLLSKAIELQNWANLLLYGMTVVKYLCWWFLPHSSSHKTVLDKTEGSMISARRCRCLVDR